MSAKLFDDELTYRRKDIRPRLGNVSDRTLDVLLRDVPRIALSRKFIVYRGSDLNALVEGACRRGESRSAPSGAAADRAHSGGGKA